MGVKNGKNKSPNQVAKRNERKGQMHQMREIRNPGRNTLF